VGTGPEPRSETAIDRHSEPSPAAAAELGAKAGERATANLAPAGGGGREVGNESPWRVGWEPEKWPRAQELVRE
jgi:hypothetical protein